MEFQIEMNYCKGCKSWSYFATEENKTVDELKEIAIKTVNDEWKEDQKTRFTLHTPTPARPTIYIFEYDNVKKCKVKNGISFKTKWR